MSNPEFNDDVYLQLVRAQSNANYNQQNMAASIFGFGNPRPLSKLELAKKWLKDNGGAHPGCLGRFMQARGVACKS